MRRAKVTKTPVQNCFLCGWELNSTVYAGGPTEAEPKEGTFSICSHCGCVMVFDEGLHRRLATNDEIKEQMRSECGDDMLEIMTSIRSFVLKPIVPSWANNPYARNP